MTLSLRPLRFEDIDAERGSLAVPMDRTSPGGGTVELAFVRLPSRTERPGPPIVFLSGGPGISGIEMGRGRLLRLFDALRSVGDVVLLDQRGCGDSTPPLACDEPLVLPFERVLSRDELLVEAIASTRRCAERLKQRGVDLRAFNTRESAADIADLARALGADRVSLLGWSYGTHLAFAVLRQHEGVVARAVLAGPEGPDHTFKLPSRVQSQLETIEARAAVAAPDSPRLIETMRRVLERVERKPARVVLPVPGGGTRPATIGRFDLERMTAEGIADTRMLARLPRWFARMACGDFDDVARDPLLRSYFERLRTGLNRSLIGACMDCASGASDERRRLVEREARTALLGRTIDFPFPEICDAIGQPDLGDAFRAPVRSAVDVLFVTGSLDARTPAGNVVDIAPGFSNRRHLVVEDAGHTDLLLPHDVQRAVVRYFECGELERERVLVDPPIRVEPAQPILLYDGECAFCRRQVERLRARVGDAVSFEPYQSARWASGLGVDLERSVHWVDGGFVAAGAEAVLRARAAAKRGSALLWMYRRIPGFAALAESVYRLVARYRGAAGRMFPGI